jgi:Ca2+-binding RTX toxin-like protein
MARRLTARRYRIALTVAGGTLLTLFAGIASAADARQFTADFRDSNGVITLPCVVKSTANTLSLRITKADQGGPPLREADITLTGGFTGVSAGTPSSTQGDWSSSASGSVVSLEGGSPGLIHDGSWVQVPITSTAPATANTYTWTVTAGGPGGPGHTISGNHPAVKVVNTASECPGAAQVAGAGPCVRPTITGTSGDDLLVGTPGNDVILDLIGNNTVLGSGGNDIVCTGPGNDHVRTLKGNDIAWDQGGRNVIGVGSGNDNVTTANGPSRIRTGPGNDTVSAGRGRNQIRTLGGRDQVIAGDGADIIKTGKGKDAVRAGNGRNRLGGGRGNDRLVAGRGADRLNGGRGLRDVCRGGTGRSNTFRGCEVMGGRGA